MFSTQKKSSSRDAENKSAAILFSEDEISEWNAAIVHNLTFLRLSIIKCIKLSEEAETEAEE